VDEFQEFISWFLTIRLTSAVEWTPGTRSVYISGVCGPAPLTAVVRVLKYQATKWTRIIG
jgi:hypothetical protein